MPSPTLPLLILLLPFLLQAAGSAAAAVTECRDGAVAPVLHDDEVLRVATLNLGHGRGTSINQMLIGRKGIEANLTRAGESIAGAGVHIVALQELDVNSRWAGGFDHRDRLLSASGLRCAGVGLHAESWLYRFGTGLLSTVALSDLRSTAFKPTPPTTTKGLLAATLRWGREPDVREVRLASVHLDFSRGGARQRQLDRILDAVRASPLPMIVMGDFNEQWSGEDSVVRRLVREGGLQTWVPDSPHYPTYKDKRLDWILVSPELEIVDYEVLDDPVSDHRLVVAELRWREP